MGKLYHVLIAIAVCIHAAAICSHGYAAARKVACVGDGITFGAGLENREINSDKIRVLLMGDSTTEGGRGVFETSIEAIFASEPELPDIEVLNVGKGGETAHSLFAEGRYERDISGVGKVDYIFFRYGINDWFHRLPVEEHFRSDVVAALGRLRSDFPEAQIVLMSIIPFLDTPKSEIVNEYIREIAKHEGLTFFDIYPAYSTKMKELGQTAMTIRFFPFSEVPEQYQVLLRPYTRYYDWKDAEWVSVQSNEFDPLMGHLDGWYEDQHPNATGYRFLASETAKFLQAQLLEDPSSGAP